MHFHPFSLNYLPHQPPDRLRYRGVWVGHCRSWTACQPRAAGHPTFQEAHHLLSNPTKQKLRIRIVSRFCTDQKNWKNFCLTYVGGESWGISRGRIQRKTWCMGPGVDYNLILCPLQSRTMGGQPYATVDLNPMPESTLTLCQSRLFPLASDFGFGLCKLSWNTKIFLFKARRYARV